MSINPSQTDKEWRVVVTEPSGGRSYELFVRSFELQLIRPEPIPELTPRLHDGRFDLRYLNDWKPTHPLRLKIEGDILDLDKPLGKL
jgi:hypothetical protein